MRLMLSGQPSRMKAAHKSQRFGSGLSAQIPHLLHSTLKSLATSAFCLYTIHKQSFCLFVAFCEFSGYAQSRLGVWVYSLGCLQFITCFQLQYELQILLWNPLCFCYWELAVANNMEVWIKLPSRSHSFTIARKGKHTSVDIRAHQTY